jgi:hypothetical protein
MEEIHVAVRRDPGEGQSPVPENQLNSSLTSRPGSSSGLTGDRPVRRLLRRLDAQEYLQLTADQLQKLIDTGQITLLIVVGQERFDTHQIDRLVDIYRTTEERRRK